MRVAWRWARLLALAWLLAGCGEAGQRLPLAFSGATMGTGYTVKVLALPQGVSTEQLGKGIAGVLEEVNGRMSTYKEDSELSRFNRNMSTDWIPVSRELLAVIKEAQRVSALSGGAFDVTVGPLVNLWGFGPEARPDEVPAQEQIAAAKARVGYHYLHTRQEPPALKKDRGDIYVDLSALAKGYGVDRVCAYLESVGLVDYMVEVGGDLKARGHNAAGGPWRIAVEKPVPGERTVDEVIAVSDSGVATSGDYRNFFEKGGRRYSHTIDPTTGRPVTHNLASITVLASTAMRADALATALDVMGPQAGFELAQHKGIAALFIVRQRTGFGHKQTSAFPRSLAQ